MNSTRTTTKAFWGGLLLIGIVALSTRLVALGHLQPWEDEIWSYMGSTDLVDKMLRWETPGNREHSPLPFLEIKITRALLGDSWFTLRLPSAIYGAASVMLFYGVLARWVSWPLALMASFLLAVHPYSLEWHRWARMYGPWMFYSVAALGLVLAATEQMRRDTQAGFADWRWWLLGLVCMLIHASAIHGLMTLAAFALALLLLALMELPKSPSAAGKILFGSALAGGVYLCSWAATGLGKVLMLTRTAQDRTGLSAESKLRWVTQATFEQLSGHVTCGVGIAFFLLALVGMGLLVFRNRHGALGLTTLLMGGVSLVSMFIIAHKHIVATRYVFILLLPLCLGIASLLVNLWSGLGTQQRLVRLGLRGLSVLIGLAWVVLWIPGWTMVYTAERTDARTALAPIFEQAQMGEMIMPIPEWYEVTLRFYKVPGKLSRLFPPREARFVHTGSTSEMVGPGKYYQYDFEVLFAPDAPADMVSQRPTAIWLFIMEPTQRLPTVRRVFEAYGLNPDACLQQLQEVSRGKLSLTLRVSTQGLEHITTTLPQRRP